MTEEVAPVLPAKPTIINSQTFISIGLGITMAGTLFSFGAAFQRLDTVEKNYSELKTSVKEELQALRGDIRDISESIADIRVLLVQTNANTSQKQ